MKEDHTRKTPSRLTLKEVDAKIVQLHLLLDSTPEERGDENEK